MRIEHDIFQTPHQVTPLLEDHQTPASYFRHDQTLGETMPMWRVQTEGYMDGTITFGDDDLGGFLEFVMMNVDRSDNLWWRRLTQITRGMRRRFDQWNPAHRSRQNVAHHYDLSAELYDLFLDEDRQYSCA